MKLNLIGKQVTINSQLINYFGNRVRSFL